MLKIDYNCTRFCGDEAFVLVPLMQLPGLCFRAYPRRVCKEVIEIFEKSGESRHRPMSTTLWVILEWCLVKGNKFRLAGSNREGWLIEKL